MPKKQAYKKLNGRQVTIPSTSHSRFQWIRKQDEELEDLEVYTLRVITEWFENPVEPEQHTLD